MLRPKVLWLYAALLAQPFFTVAIAGDANGFVAGAALLAAVLGLGVLKGVRAVWILAIASQIVVLLPFGDFRLWAIGLNLVGLACLLAPDVRRFETQRNAPSPTGRRDRSEPTAGASKPFVIEHERVRGVPESTTVECTQRSTTRQGTIS